MLPFCLEADVLGLHQTRHNCIHFETLVAECPVVLGVLAINGWYRSALLTN